MKPTVGTSTFHPLRWGAVVFIGLPAALWIVARIFGSGAEARVLLRSVRYLIGVEITCLFLAAVVGAAYQARQSARERRLYPPPGKLVDVGNRSRLHVYCVGEGSPTVILESGLSGMSFDWYAVQSPVARFTRVCAYDRAGYGWSDSSSRPRTSKNMAEELHALLSRAEIKAPYVLVGHSMGGFNVHLYASRYPNEVAGVVLVDSSHPDELLHFSVRGRAWIRFLELTAPFGLPRWRRWCANGPEEIRAERAAFTCRAQYYRTKYAETAAFAESAAQARSAGTLGNIPLIVIVRDVRVGSRAEAGVRNGQDWYKKQLELSHLSSNGKLIIAEGSRHVVQWDRPDVVICAIREIVLAVKNGR